MLSTNRAALDLTGEGGQRLVAAVRVKAPDTSPVPIEAISDQPWVVAHAVEREGSVATIRLVVPAVPDSPGATLGAVVRVLMGGRPVHEVMVRLKVQPRTVEKKPPISWLQNAPQLQSPFPSSPAPQHKRDERPPAPANVIDWLPAPTIVPGNLPPQNQDAPPRRSSAYFWVGLAVVGLLITTSLGLAIAFSLRPKTVKQEQQADSKSNTGRDKRVGTIDGKPGDKEDPADDPSSGDDDAGGLKPIDDPTRPRTTRPIPKQVPLLVGDLVTREVEVVFCLDTTGSMGGLLNGAKQKIWAMCSQIAGGKPTPQLRVGLVAYKDRGDVYVTKIHDLSRDLDGMYQNLNELTAKGGGDEPESVNQALDDAVNKIKWSTDTRTLRIIFLVGDAPPHMDYDDDVKYPDTCKKACEKGIIINAIQCGRNPRCKTHWEKIAEQAKGAYAAIEQRGGVVTLASPFDGDLSALLPKLFDTALLYGSELQKKRGEKMLTSARFLRGATGADRVAFAAKSKRISPYDLIDALRAKRIKLEDVKDDQLPDKMKDLKTQAERRKFVEKVLVEREKLEKQVLELEKKRAAHLMKDLAKKKVGKDGFDIKVLEMLRKQAKKFDISY